ncbi:MAG: glycosyltransferase [Candidatus Viridilinea halotolerans]|uniref:4,4'-diaponeurosporenoate glycosyltransferase n=1 Tax=Candidatus Viridilinea halotolerans TaxID=2491704 RepID=A0A426U485_9CHLR|nr:MAG: glycosyltransferase [Candidatus Viridilinea halotolerans]
MTTFSIIIPTLNEADGIAACITAVRALDPAVEVVVADGGSTDATVEQAQQAGATVIQAPRGRGPQCNAGAAAANSEILMFLHADTHLPTDAFTLLHQWFAEPKVRIAKFRLSFDVSNPLLDCAACLMWWDSRLTSYGDQGIVIRRDFFNALGGFPPWPLFEDVRLFELARAQTRVYVLPAQVVTSSRRFQANGSLAQLIVDVGLWLEYVAGVSPNEIAARYERR